MKCAFHLVSCMVCSSFGIAFAGPMPSPTAEQIKAENLVRALGDHSYKVREQAGMDLLLLGRSAFAALQQGMQDENPEIRSRCRRLWPRILDVDLQARLDAFLADPEGKQSHDLPGWDRFRKLVGEDRPARELFAKMVRADGAMMDAAENRTEEFSPERLVLRSLQLQQMANNPRADVKNSATEGDYAQILFLSTNAKISGLSAQAQQVGTVFYQQTLLQALRNGEHADVLKKLVIAWFEQHIDDSPTIVYQIGYLASQVGLKELVPAALRVVKNSKVTPYVRGNALTVVGRLGGKEHISAIEPFLADTTTVANFVQQQRLVAAGGAGNRQMSTAQLGDVALAMTIHLSGQKPADFGYEMTRTNPNALFSCPYLGFPDDATRANARRKWKEWLDKNKEEKK